MVRYLEVLNKFEWEKEGKKNYAYNYAVIVLEDSKNNIKRSVKLSYNEKKNCNEPYTQIVSLEEFEKVCPGDVWSFEYDLDAFDRKVPYLSNKVINIHDIILQ